MTGCVVGENIHKAFIAILEPCWFQQDQPLTEDQPNMTASVRSCFVNERETGGAMMQKHLKTTHQCWSSY